MAPVTLLIVLAFLIIRRQRRQARLLITQRNKAEQLAYVGTLAAGLAHEIRNPINALAMQLELLEEDMADSVQQKMVPRLTRIRTGLAGVERTVHDFLTFATPDRQKPKLVELDSLTGALCTRFIEGREQEHIEIQRLIPPGLEAWCDPHGLRQILDNLISNGLRAQRGRPGPPVLRIEASRNGPWVEVLVDDAGPGVPPELREKIFDCFFTTLPEGTGLGLPIARRLAEMNRGELSLDPKPSPLGGCRFRLQLSARPLRGG
jgi:two-component system sensor histidine kinase HydH